ncbi:MAG TPA: hypothetical protein VFS43_15755 [Polyangiaceae bacterium]|nr:hypothetical protein [Polyangiaceae bacterium]
MTTRAQRCALAAALLAAACSPAPPPAGPPGGEHAGEGGSGGDEGEGGTGGDEGEGGTGGDKGEGGGEGEGAEGVRAVLQAQCGGCHTGTHCGSTGGGFGDPFDVDAIFACGHLVPGSPDASPLWQRIKNDDMPPTGRLSRAEKGAVRAWIEAGAPAPPPGG